jgi:hypothetical protein
VCAGSECTEHVTACIPRYHLLFPSTRREEGCIPFVLRAKKCVTAQTPTSSILQEIQIRNHTKNYKKSDVERKKELTEATNN